MTTRPEDMAARLSALQAKAADLQRRFSEPPSFEEPDSPVTATMSTDGPVIRVADDWADRVAADQLGAAVNRAVALALAPPRMPEANTEAWSVDHVPFDIVETARRITDLATPMIRDAVTAAERGRAWSPDAEPSDPDHAVVGTNESRRVRVVLVDGSFRRCEIDAQWAANKSGKAIAMAFSDALVEAQQEAEPATTPSRPAEAGIHDAAALLNELRGRL